MKISAAPIELGPIRLRAVLFDVFVRIEPAVERQHADVHAFIEKQLDRLLGRVRAGRVGIEIDHHGVGDGDGWSAPARW